MNDREYKSAKSRMLDGKAMTYGSLERLYEEAKRRNDVQVWPALECVLAKRSSGGSNRIIEA